MVNLSFKNRISITIGAVVVLFAACSMFLVEFYIKDMLVKENLDDAEDLAAMIAGHISKSVKANELFEVDSIFQSMVRMDNEIDYVLLEKDGKAALQASRRSFPESVLNVSHPPDKVDALMIEADGRQYIDISAPLGDGSSGILRIGIRERLEDSITYRILGTLAFITVVLLGASLFLANVLSNRLTAPIRDLIASTRRLSGGDYTATAAETNDEIGELARSFNQMAGSIKTREEELRSVNTELEAVNVKLHEYISQLNQTRAELIRSQQDAAVTDTSRAFLHHLRQPLTYLLMATEMLLEEVAESADSREPLALKIRAIEEAAKQVSLLLRKLEKVKSYKTMEYDEYSKIIDIDT